MHRYQ